MDITRHDGNTTEQEFAVRKHSIGGVIVPIVNQNDEAKIKGCKVTEFAMDALDAAPTGFLSKHKSLA
jgi:hypothetical protein